MLFEEELVEKLSAFYRAMGWREEVQKEGLEYIDKGLIVLKEDSIKHKTMAQDLIKYVGESSQDEL